MKVTDTTTGTVKVYKAEVMVYGKIAIQNLTVEVFPDGASAAIATLENGIASVGAVAFGVVGYCTIFGAPGPPTISSFKAALGFGAEAKRRITRENAHYVMPIYTHLLMTDFTSYL